MTLRTMRSLRRALLCFAAVFATLTLSATAATINVPSTATPTIQSGIDAAANGDTVLVAPGTYYENIDFKGKAITVTSGSAATAASTIIDGGSTSPTVTFVNGETRSSVLSYLTIQHGGGYGSSYTGLYNGGLYLSGSSPVILNNIVMQNACWTFYVVSSAPLIQGNNISATQDPHGTCSFGGGAAIYVSGNFFGPGQSSSNGTPAMIVGNTIENNVESGLEDAGGNGGAGIAVWGGSPIIAKNIIRNNASPGGSGGAINIEGGTNVAIMQNLIYGNSAGCGGGALAFDAGNSDPAGFGVLIANNTIVDNTYDKNGGGFSECTNIAQIYPNPDEYGGGSPQEVLVNNIIAGNTTDPAIDGDYAFDGVSEASQPIFDHNLFYNPGGLVFGSTYVDVSAKYGNLVADPQFVDQANHDYHLKPTSPAIDAGNTSVLQSLQTITGSAVTTDFDGNPRLQDATGKGYPIIDMGAYEYAGQVNATDTTVVLTSSSYQGDAGSNYVLTATLASALGTPTGFIAFFLDGEQIGISKIGSDGTATLANFLMTPGVHSLYASYAGSGSFTPAISVIIIVQINLYTTSLTLTSNSNPSILSQPVTFTLTATSSDPTFVPSPITLYENGSNTPLTTLTPNSAGLATYATSSLPLGYNSITASFAGDSTHAGASTNIEQDVINGYATTTSLISSSNPANLGQSVTFTATVTSANGTPTGLITFTDGATTLGVVTLVNGVATYTTSTLAVGTHPIASAYNPTGTTFNASMGNLSQVINGIATSTSLSVAPTTAVYGTQIVMTSAVTASGVSVTGGTLTFMDGASAIAAGEPIGSLLSVSYSDINLTVGTHIITAVYSGDATHNASTSPPVTVTITAATTTLALTSTPNPALAFQQITLIANLTGAGGASTITFLSNGTAIGTAQTTAQGIATFTTSLPAGTYTLTAAFAGNTNTTASASAPVTEVVNKDASSTAMSASPNPAYSPGDTVNLFAAAKPVVPTSAGSYPLPSGIFTFYDGQTAIATGTAPSQATVPSASISNFAVGPHILTAVYSGDANYLPSTSAPVTLNILLSDFTLTTDPSITIQTEHHKDLNLTLASLGNFADTIDLNCGNLPVYASCNFGNQTPGLAAGATLPFTVDIDTDAVRNFESDLVRPTDRPGSKFARTRLSEAIAFALLLPVTLLATRRRSRRSLRLFITFAAFALAATLTGCSGHYPGHTPPGSYTVTITGQGVATHITHTTTVTLIVTP